MLARRNKEEQAQPVASEGPSPVVLLTNMVGPGEVDADLQPETAEECSKFGQVKNCVIYECPKNTMPDTEAVRIFIEFINISSAKKGGRCLISVHAPSLPHTSFLPLPPCAHVWFVSNPCLARLRQNPVEHTSPSLGVIGRIRSTQSQPAAIELLFCVCTAIASLDGRFFGGRNVRAKFYSVSRQVCAAVCATS